MRRKIDAVISAMFCLGYSREYVQRRVGDEPTVEEFVKLDIPRKDVLWVLIHVWMDSDQCRRFSDICVDRVKTREAWPKPGGTWGEVAILLPPRDAAWTMAWAVLWCEGGGARQWEVDKALEIIKEGKYVLVNVMGAGEYRGSNINADYFSEAALYHKGKGYGYSTFYNAHPYRHQNKDPKKTVRDFTVRFYKALEDEEFEHAIKRVGDKCHKIARDKGFWESDRSFGEAVALMHSELSEALEAAREGDPNSGVIGEYSAVEEELADVCIRIFDWCGAKGLRLGGAILAKMRHNEKRPHKHGKKF